MAKKKAMRRANGHGSVYKLKGNRRRPWVARISEGVEETEEGSVVIKRRIIGYFELEDEANKALLGHRLDPLPTKSNITLDELYEEWKTIHFPKVSESSVKAYEYGWKQIASLKNVKMKEIRRGQWERIMLQMAGKVGSSSISHMLNIAGMLSTYAVQNDIIPRNYTEGIKPPKEEQKEKQPFNDLELKKIKESAGSVPYAEHILIMCYTGFRIQELLNITKFDIDFQKHTIKGGMKTEAGRGRIVPIHPVIYPHIKKIASEATGSHIFEVKGKGRPITQATFRNRYYEALEAMNIEKRTPHICRHTCATMMANSGVSVNVIKAVLGHSNYNFTANRYTHIDTEHMLKEIEQM